MSKFKAGDLAMVIGCNVNPKNLGRVVELVTLISPGQVFHAPNGRKNLACPDEQVDGWIVRSEEFISRDGEQWGWVEERHLMPIRRDFQPEQQKAKEVSV